MSKKRHARDIGSEINPDCERHVVRPIREDRTRPLLSWWFPRTTWPGCRRRARASSSSLARRQGHVGEIILPRIPVVGK